MILFDASKFENSGEDGDEAITSRTIDLKGFGSV
jgi:hypothetical protein